MSEYIYMALLVWLPIYLSYRIVKWENKLSGDAVT
jgi:hypothetical protein